MSTYFFHCERATVDRQRLRNWILVEHTRDFQGQLRSVFLEMCTVAMLSFLLVMHDLFIAIGIYNS